MTVRELKRQLEHCDDDAIVYVRNPEFYDGYTQEAHWNLGARYLVYCGDRVWFETYKGEAIDDEIDAIAEVAEKEDWDEWDFYEELFDPHKHGYTLEDIKRACPNRYENCKEYLETYGII